MIRRVLSGLAGAACLAIAPIAAWAQSAQLALNDYAEALAARDEAAAITAGRAVLDVDLTTLGFSAEDAREMRADVADRLARSGDVEQAIDIYEQILAELEAEHGDEAFVLVDVLARLSELRALLGAFADADADLSRAVAIAEAALDAEAPRGLLWLLEARRALDAQRVAAVGDAEARVIEARFEETDARIENIETLARDRRQRISTLGPTTTGEDARTDEDHDMELVRVHYGTNRARASNVNPARFYGPDQGPLELGVVEVSTRRNRELSFIPRVVRFRFEVLNDESLDAVLESVEPTPHDEFYADLRRSVADSSGREVFIFVHGYNSTFAEAAEQTARLAIALEVDGAAVMYSWPSQGSAAGYIADIDMRQSVIDDMQRFLTNVVERSGARRVNLMAHSLGNRHLLRALEQMRRDGVAVSRPNVFEEIVFARPDVDAEDFAYRLPAVASLAENMTLYASNRDRALGLSGWLRGAPRAGDAEPLLVVPDLFETIDASTVEPSGWGGDFWRHDIRPLINDLRGLFWFSLRPDDRCTVAPASNGGGAYWRIASEGGARCSENAFRHAVIFTRRLGPERARTVCQGGGDDWVPVCRLLDEIQALNP